MINGINHRQDDPDLFVDVIQRMITLGQQPDI